MEARTKVTVTFELDTPRVQELDKKAREGLRSRNRQVQLYVEQALAAEKAEPAAGT